MPDLHTDRTLDLINRSLDGDLSVDEKRELDRSADSEPATARLLRDYQALERLLASVPQEDPSPALRASILAALPPVRSSQTEKLGKAWVLGIVDFLQPSTRHVGAWAAALAVILAVVVVLTVGLPEVDPSQTTGTMSRSGSASGQSMHISSTASIDGAAASLTLEFGAGKNSELEVAYDSHHLRFMSADGPREVMQPEDEAGILRLAVEEGGHVQLHFRVSGVPDPIRMTLLRDGLPVVSELVPWSPVP